MAQWNKDRVLKFLLEFAPSVPLHRAMDLAEEIESNRIKSVLDDHTLAILSKEVIGMDENGRIPCKFKDCRPAVQWALSRTQSIHCFVACDSFNSFEKVMKTIEDEQAIEPFRYEDCIEQAFPFDVSLATKTDKVPGKADVNDEAKI